MLEGVDWFGASAPAVLCAVAVAVLLVAEHRGLAVLRALGKLAASTAFLWAAFVWGVADSRFGEWILLGLALCWVGDALLLSSGQSRAFALGIGAFLLGHLAYAVACVAFPLDPLALGVAGGGVLAGSWWVLRALVPHVPGSFRAPVFAYVAVISCMVVLACAASGGGAHPLLAVGALGFAVSDLSVARDRFLAPGFANVAWGLPLYFASQLAIAYAAAASPPPAWSG